MANSAFRRVLCRGSKSRRGRRSHAVTEADILPLGYQLARTSFFGSAGFFRLGDLELPAKVLQSVFTTICTTEPSPVLGSTTHGHHAHSLLVSTARCRSYRRRLFWWFCRKGWPWRGGFEARTTPVQLLQRVVRNRVRNLIWHRWNCLTEEPLESFTDAVGRQLRTETLEYLEQGAKRGFLPRANFHRCALFDLSGPYYASRASPPVNAGSLKARRHRDIQGRRPGQRLCLANQPDPIGGSADP